MLCVFTGASACVQLKKFDEAITWCDKGLAVSFPKVKNYFYLELISLSKSSLRILSAVAAARLRENIVRRPTIRKERSVTKTERNWIKSKALVQETVYGRINQKTKDFLSSSQCEDATYWHKNVPYFQPSLDGITASQYQFQDSFTVSYQQWPVIKVSFICEVTSKYRISIGCLPVQVSSLCIMTMSFSLRHPQTRKCIPFSN